MNRDQEPSEGPSSPHSDTVTEKIPHPEGDCYHKGELPHPRSELQRRRSNEIAWKRWHGYETTSGCPCFDRSRFFCIPRHSGYGVVPNFFALCCCFLCLNVNDQVRSDETQH